MVSFRVFRTLKRVFPAPGSGCFSTVFPRLHGLTGKNKLNFIPGQAGSADYFIHALTFPVAVEDNLAQKMRRAGNALRLLDQLAQARIRSSMTRFRWTSSC